MLHNSKFRFIVLSLLLLSAVGGLWFARDQIRAATAHFLYPLRSDSLDMWWKLDSDGTETIHGYSGTVVGTSKATGKVDGALTFNGTSDKISLSSLSNNTTSYGAMTFSVWAKDTRASSAVDSIIFSYVDNGCGASIFDSLNNALGQVCGENGSAATISSGVDTRDGSWHLWTVTFNGTAVRLYLDAVLKGQTSTWAGGTGVTPTTIKFNNESGNTPSIGNYVNSSSFFQGSVDDLRIYNKVLSADEIKQYYDATSGGHAIVGSPSRPLSTPNANGLVGYWDFDDCDSCGTAADRSGNGNIGTMYTTSCNTAAGNLHTSSGKIGNGASFDGTNDCINMGNPSVLSLGTGSFTVSAWVYSASFGSSQMGIVSKAAANVGAAGFNLTYNRDTATPGKFAFWIYDPADTDPRVTGKTTPMSGWHHVVGVRDASVPTLRIYVDGVDDSGTVVAAAQSNETVNNSYSFVVGQYPIDNLSANTAPFNGSIDDVRVYNRALSAGEITNLYNSTRKITANVSPTTSLTSGLVGYWTFDGNDTPWTSATAATTIDRSGNNNTGTLTNMSQSTSVVPGIHGQALQFDGVNDNISVTDADSLSFTNNVVSISAWIKRDNLTDLDQIVTKRTSSVFEYQLYSNASTGRVDFNLLTSAGTDVCVAAGGTSLAAGQWYHVAGTSDGTTCRVYLNGGQDGTGSVSGSMSNTTANFLVGYDGSGTATRYFNGSIDEVRIYNRALSGAEVQQLYNAGRR